MSSSMAESKISGLQAFLVVVGGVVLLISVILQLSERLPEIWFHRYVLKEQCKVLTYTDMFWQEEKSELSCRPTAGSSEGTYNASWQPAQSWDEARAAFISCCFQDPVAYHIFGDQYELAAECDRLFSTLYEERVDSYKHGPPNIRCSVK